MHFHKKVTCVTGEVAEDYSQYLLTKHWKILRIAVAEQHNYTCLRCYSVINKGFHVHHNTYKRLGKEQLKDLGFYCAKCHAVIHNDRKNKRTFNRQYNSLISNKMSKFTVEEIERVLDFIDTIAKGK